MGIIAWMLSLELLNLLLEQDLVPWRDLDRASRAVARGEQHDLRVMSHTNPALDDLIFRNFELEGWDQMSEDERVKALSRAHRRKARAQKLEAA